jgi:hypothetical protein
MTTDCCCGEKAFDAPDAHVMCGGEGCGGRAGAIGGDQVGAIVLVETVSQAPWPLGCRCDGAGVVRSTTLTQSCRSVSFAVCE